MSQFVIMWWICTYKGTANEKRSEESAFGGCIFQDKDEEFSLLNDVLWYQKS